MYECDYLILLVGTNPLPNYISSLTSIKDIGTIFLIYTKEDDVSMSTKIVAENTENEIKKKLLNVLVIKQEIDKSNIRTIKSTLQDKILNKILEENCEYDELNICLDFTGGTKILAVQSYEFFKDAEKKYENFQIDFSYVDSNIKKIIYEKNYSIEFEYASLKYNVSIDNILNLHGYRIINIEDNTLSKIEIEDFYKKDKFSIDEIYLKDFTICIVIKSQKKSRGTCKLELFEGRNNSIKIAGELSYLFYLCEADGETLGNLKNDLADSEMLQNKDQIMTFNKIEDLLIKINNFSQGLY